MILYWPPIKEHVKIIQLVYFNLCISQLEGFVLMSAVEWVSYVASHSFFSTALSIYWSWENMQPISLLSKKSKKKLRKMFKSCFRWSALHDLSKRTSDEHACT